MMEKIRISDIVSEQCADTVVLYIADQLGQVIDRKNQRESQHYRAIVQYRNYVQALESHEFLSGKPTKLVIARDVHGTIQAIRIPQKDSKRLLDYLMNGHGRHDDFDCQSFSHKIKGSSMRYPHHNNAKVFFHKRIDR